MEINGITYEVLGEREIGGRPGRVEVILRRPNGKRLYHAVRYENGTVSGVV